VQRRAKPLGRTAVRAGTLACARQVRTPEAAIFARVTARATTGGWHSWHRQTANGAVESEQRLRVDAPVVGFSEDGARTLGNVYWAEVERTMRGCIRRDPRSGGVELRVAGRGPVLLALGEPELVVTATAVVCCYPIVGGLLSREPGGDISFAQTAAGSLELRSTIRGFVPTLAAREGRPH